MYAEIDTYIHEHSVMSSDEAAEFVLSVIVAPDADSLKLSYVKRLFNSRVKRVRGNDGIRSVFSTSAKTNPFYVNVEIAQPEDLEYLRLARKAQNKNIKQMKKNVRKIRRREIVLEGQLGLSDFKEDED